MRRLPMLLTACACALAALLAGGALAATKRAAAPRVVTVKPLHAGIGDTLTIRGTNFRPGRLATWIVFQRDRARPVFARAEVASRTQIRIKIPEKLRPFLSLKNGQPAATRFRIRVLASTFGKEFTAKASSPLIGPAPLGGTKPPPEASNDCDNDKIPNSTDTDDDNDLLPDSREKLLKTDPCKADSDGDGVSDYFEVESALDLNSRANFYPVKKPYPNPNFPDANIDFDGDGMTNSDEFSAWVRYGGGSKDLNYSDGCQDTRAGGGCSGPPTAVPSNKPWLDFDGNGRLTDDEKDVDNDGATNWDEAHGRLVYDWWSAAYETEKPYKPQYGSLDWLDPDTDGDGVLDGYDDQDYDDVNNINDINRGPNWVQPFNPCLPDWTSRTCSRHPPLKDPWPPFDTSGFRSLPIPLPWPPVVPGP